MTDRNLLKAGGTATVRKCIVPVLVLVFVAGCSQSGEEESGLGTENIAAAATPVVPPKNCLLIVLDAFYAGHVTHLGYPRDTTPRIDALARQGISFSNAYSQSPVTLGSVVSFMSGRYLPIPHDSAFKYTLNATETTLPEAFKQAGFATAAYSENPYVRKRGGFSRGFDVFRMEAPLESRRPGEIFSRRNENITPALLDEAAEWVKAQAGQPWMAYLHLLRPHDPYLSPAPYATKFIEDGRVPGDEFRAFELDVVVKAHHTDYVPTPEEIQYLVDMYDGSISYIDALVGAFLDDLRAAGRLDDTLIVIYSDHGEAFYQHQRFKHTTTVFNEMLHVPFIFIPPANSGWTPGTRNDLVELIDLYPTISEIFSLDSAQPLHGVSLVSALNGGAPVGAPTVYAQTPPADTIMFRNGYDKLCFGKVDTGLELVAWFDLRADPGEQKNLLPNQSPPDRLVQQAKQAIEAFFVSPADAATDLDAEQAEMLRSLGYVE